MNISLKKILHFLAFGSFSLIGCAKYGAPIDFDPYKGIKAVTENNEAIENLVVELNGITEKTNSEGIAEFNNVCDYYTDYYVQISDSDGQENGGDFESQRILLSDPDITTVVMKKKQ